MIICPQFILVLPQEYLRQTSYLPTIAAIEARSFKAAMALSLRTDYLLSMESAYTASSVLHRWSSVCLEAPCSIDRGVQV